MSDNRASPLATAFMWAISAAVGYGGFGVVLHEKPSQIRDELAMAVPLAAVVAYIERKDALKPR